MQASRGIGGAILVMVAFSTMTSLSVLAFGWGVQEYPIAAVSAAMLASFGGVSARPSVVALAVKMNPSSSAGATAALVCFQFALSIPELMATGALLHTWPPSYIYTLWAGLVILAMPLALIVVYRYWNVDHPFPSQNTNKEAAIQ